mmetsp:Transcript_91165/g.294582  ORF Transcript_91165/g.294582 Transcript_91165/m.294582 type:complete len:252 (+) Transcript_91165:813-1568(+)
MEHEQTEGHALHNRPCDALHENVLPRLRQVLHLQSQADARCHGVHQALRDMLEDAVRLIDGSDTVGRGEGQVEGHADEEKDHEAAHEKWEVRPQGRRERHGRRARATSLLVPALSLDQGLLAGGGTEAQPEQVRRQRQNPDRLGHNGEFLPDRPELTAYGDGRGEVVHSEACPQAGNLGGETCCCCDEAEGHQGHEAVHEDCRSAETRILHDLFLLLLLLFLEAHAICFVPWRHDRLPLRVQQHSLEGCDR